MWQINDDEGTIHSGSEDEMRTAFYIMTGQLKATRHERDEWSYDWKGDLELVQVHEVFR